LFKESNVDVKITSFQRNLSLEFSSVGARVGFAKMVRQGKVLPLLQAGI
jgi:hypothetical protein